MFTMTIVFCMLLAGSQYIVGPFKVEQSRQGALAVGLVLWNLLILSLGEITNGVQAEAQIGTLEHLFLASQSLLRTMLLRALASEALFLVTNSLILAVVILASRASIAFSSAAILPLVTALLAANGIGLALGATAVIWKRVGSLLHLIQLFVAGVVIPPFEQFLPNYLLPLTNLLPLAPQARALRNCLIQGASLSTAQTLILTGNGLAYFFIGIIVFRFGERSARRSGSLSTY
jgi:ABC-2 type transport system permease protein